MLLTGRYQTYHTLVVVDCDEVTASYKSRDAFVSSATEWNKHPVVDRGEHLPNVSGKVNMKMSPGVKLT